MLELNTKFLSFGGVIGRRDFAINIFYIILMRTLLVDLPYSAYMLTSVSKFSDLFNLSKIFISMPILFQVWIIVAAICFSCLFISNVVRRLNDINAKENKTLNTIISLLFVLPVLSYFLPLQFSLFVGLVLFLILLCLFFKSGKITKNYPYDFTKEFNWGAFFGTWIWGLWNKSYQALWMIILSFTPAGFYFSLICGLKGNEWAYKNKKWNDDKKFLKSQENQTIFFIIFACIILPLFYMFICIFFAVFLAIGISKADPAEVGKKLENIVNFVDEMYFDSHTILKNENKFYISPSDWAGYSIQDKRQILDFASTIAAAERTKMSKTNRHYTKTTELSRTKIYNSKNKEELLGEFYLDSSVINPQKFKASDILKIIDAYRFYTPIVK